MTSFTTDDDMEANCTKNNQYVPSDDQSVDYRELLSELGSKSSHAQTPFDLN
jgi:hypothetical protein